MREHDSFWTQENRNKLRDQFEVAITALGLRFQQIPAIGERAIKENWRKKFVASTATYRRLHGGTNVKPQWYTGLLFILHTFCTERRENEKIPQLLSGTMLLYEDFNQIFSADVNDITADIKSRATVSLKTGLSYLKIGFEGYSRFCDIFFSGTKNRRLYFETFRFSSKPGYIQKSFTVITRNSSIVPLVRFANYFEHRGRTRVSTGLLLPFREVIAFLGESDDGASIKLMVVKRSERPQEVYSGLLITLEPEAELVAARFVMMKSAAASHKEVDAREIHMDDLEDSKRHVISGIRNRIRFEVEGKLFDESRNPLTKTRILSILDNVIHRHAGIFDSDENPLNPMSEENFTFNAALKIRD